MPKTSSTRLEVSIERRLVTDGRTDGHRAMALRRAGTFGTREDTDCGST